jgi:hypothetical protein
MLRQLVSALAVGAALCGLASPASAQLIFSDGFESYPGGTLPPQGGWTDFGGSQPIVVSTTQAHSGTNSMRLSEGTDTIGGTTSGYGSDIFRNFLPTGTITSGTVNFAFWQFIEPAVDSVAFVYISTGRMPDTFQTGLDLRGDTINSIGFGNSLLVVQDVAGQPTAFGLRPIVTGRWVEYNMTINLSANTYTFSYDGVAATAGTWDTTPGDGVSLGGMDVWMQNGNANAVNNFVYYDDFTMTVVPVPEPSAVLLTPFGLGLWAYRRRRR